MCLDGTGGPLTPTPEPASLPSPPLDPHLMGESRDTHLGEVDRQKRISLAGGKLSHIKNNFAFIPRRKTTVWKPQTSLSLF